MNPLRRRTTVTTMTTMSITAVGMVSTVTPLSRTKPNRQAGHRRTGAETAISGVTTPA
jgi:hypothetical protein